VERRDVRVLNGSGPDIEGIVTHDPRQLDSAVAHHASDGGR